MSAVLIVLAALLARLLLPATLLLAALARLTGLLARLLLTAALLLATLARPWVVLLLLVAVRVLVLLVHLWLLGVLPPTQINVPYTALFRTVRRPFGGAIAAMA
jgi:hypothetical protein